MSAGVLRRRVFLSVGMVLMAHWAVGCTPGSKALIAVERNESGGVRLLVSPCPEFGIRTISVFLDDDTAPAEDWSLKKEGAGVFPSRIDLFAPPVGYKVDKGTLTELKPANSYVAEIAGEVGSKPLSGRVEFSLEGIGELRSGQVLTGVRGGAVMDRKEFMEAPPGDCKP
ncbi:hypothetical protein [Streptomyces yangpuensis]|uniref:hypothetical protein n=1 Tax=Streptomyces yangpuensis TaxID=1648182 RepID=UPI00365E0776